MICTVHPIYVHYTCSGSDVTLDFIDDELNYDVMTGTPFLLFLHALRTAHVSIFRIGINLWGGGDKLLVSSRRPH